jgi:hypothetical protein
MLTPAGLRTTGSLVREVSSTDRRGAMKAFAIDELGEPGSVNDLPLPEPAEGQVRIRVAAGVKR